MALEDYLPFDPDTSGSNTNDKVNDIFNEFGFDSWRDVFTDIQGEVVDPEMVRPARYFSPEEALIDLRERALLSFSTIYYIEDEDMYSILVGNSD